MSRARAMKRRRQLSCAPAFRKGRVQRSAIQEARRACSSWPRSCGTLRGLARRPDQSGEVFDGGFFRRIVIDRANDVVKIRDVPGKLRVKDERFLEEARSPKLNRAA